MATKKFGTAAQILAVDDLAVEEHEVPEWGYWVRIAELNGRDRSKYVQSLVKVEHTNGQRGGGNMKVTPDMRDAEVRLVSLSLVDADRKRLFDDTQIKALGDKSSKALSRVAGIAQRMSALGADAVEDAEEN